MDSKKEHDHRDELSSVDIGCPLSTRPFIEWHTQQNKSEPKFKKKKEREKKTKPNQTKPNDENETGKWKDDEKHGWVRLGPTFRCVCVCVCVCVWVCVSVWVCECVWGNFPLDWKSTVDRRCWRRRKQQPSA